MFGEGAAVDTDAGAPGDLEEDRQRAAEARGEGDLYAVDERRDEIVGILEGVADKVPAFDEFVEALVVVMRGAVERAGDGLSVGFGADEFVVHKIKNYSVGNALKNERKWNASQRVMAVIIPPKCTMMLAELAARAEPRAPLGGPFSLFALVDVVYAEQSTRKGSRLAKGNE